MHLLALRRNGRRVLDRRCGEPRASRLLRDGQQANAMAQLPDPSHDVPLSASDLAEVRRSFSILSTDGLRQAYADALERCKLDKRGKPPRCEHIQVLVQAW